MEYSSLLQLDQSNIYEIIFCTCYDQIFLLAYHEL